MLFTAGTYDNGEPIDYRFGWRLQYREGKTLTAQLGIVGSRTTAAAKFIRPHFADRTTVAIFAQKEQKLDRDDRDSLTTGIHESLFRSKHSRSEQLRSKQIAMTQMAVETLFPECGSSAETK